MNIRWTLIKLLMPKKDRGEVFQGLDLWADTLKECIEDSVQHDDQEAAKDFSYQFNQVQRIKEMFL